MSPVDLIQGTDDWKKARCGHLTSSRISDAFAGLKTAGRANLIAALVSERLTGVAPEGYTNEAMRWGTDKEPDARDAYEMWANVDVHLVGFIPHENIKWAGASPDGYVGEEGLVEIKCPNTATHIETLLTGKLDPKYVRQMQWQMACTGRRWCDFVSFDPRMPGDMQLYVSRLDRLNDDAMAEFEQQAKDLLVEVEKKMAELTAKFGLSETRAAA